MKKIQNLIGVGLRLFQAIECKVHAFQGSLSQGNAVHDFDSLPNLKLLSLALMMIWLP